jgi:hypothetical protein
MKTKLKTKLKSKKMKSKKMKSKIGKYLETKKIDTYNQSVNHLSHGLLILEK